MMHSSKGLYELLRMFSESAFEETVIRVTELVLSHKDNYLLDKNAKQASLTYEGIPAVIQVPCKHRLYNDVIVAFEYAKVAESQHELEYKLDNFVLTEKSFDTFAREGIVRKPIDIVGRIGDKPRERIKLVFKKIKII